jgi:hypothetical protein
MALIRWGRGSELYIYASGDDDQEIYICCACVLEGQRSFNTKEDLKLHILVHEDHGHSIGETGNQLTFQNYDELLQAVDEDDF